MIIMFYYAKMAAGQNILLHLLLHPAAVLLSSNVLVFAILETFIVLSVSLLLCMYIIYCVLFRRVLIYKIDVALQLTKL